MADWLTECLSAGCPTRKGYRRAVRLPRTLDSYVGFHTANPVPQFSPRRQPSVVAGARLIGTVSPRTHTHTVKISPHTELHLLPFRLVGSQGHVTPARAAALARTVLVGSSP